MIKGIHCGLEPRDITNATHLGAQYILLQDFETGFFTRDHLEPERNKWQKHNDKLKPIIDSGIVPVGVIHCYRTWRMLPAPTKGQHVDTTWVNAPAIGGTLLMSPWQLYVHHAVSAHPEIKHWQVGWEETEWSVLNLTGSETYNQHVDEAAYVFVEMVKQAERVIRRYNGVVIAGGFPINRGAFPWRCLQMGLSDYCDIVSIHYGYGGSDEVGDYKRYINTVNAIRSHGKPVWNTECNIMKSGDRGKVSTPENFALDRLLFANSDAGVGAVFYYYGSVGSSPHPEALWDRDGMKKWAKDYASFCH